MTAAAESPRNRVPALAPRVVGGSLAPGALWPAIRRAWRGFSSWLRSSRYAAEPPFVPAIDAVERAGVVEIAVELPGLAATDVEVTLSGHVLTIRGERRAYLEGGSELRREQGSGRFERSVAVSALIARHKIHAHLADGILHVTLPKHADPVTVPVHAPAAAALPPVEARERRHRRRDRGKSGRSFSEERPAGAPRAPE